jgi:diguanylate cyclase (GGDEF)-like protein
MSVAGWSTQQLAEYLAAISTLPDEESLTRGAVERAAEALEAEVGALIRGNRVVSSVGFPAGECAEGKLLAAANGAGLEVPGAGEGTVAVAPLDESMPGQLLLARAGDEPFTHEEMSLLRGMARVIALTLRMLRLLAAERGLREKTQREIRDRKQAEDQLAHQALHDALTGLANRNLVMDRLDHALVLARRSEAPLAVLFLDLDNFKLVNDSLGHQVGDELLVAVATRLDEVLRATDTVARPGAATVARFGGDEFLLLCEALESEQDAIHIAQRIAAALAQPFVIGEDELFVTASVGIALSGPDATSDSLIRDADAAMYRAKERGRARYEVFDQAMRARILGRLRNENELRHAIDRDELELFYQPIVSLHDGGVAGVEALVRWRHPERGLLPPIEFVPLAEESGLIIALGEWVLRAACRQFAQWYREDDHGLPLGASVNVSPRQFADPQFPAAVAKALRDTQLDPSRLALEITETALMEDSDVPGMVLEQLKAQGTRLVLDDFGTGYSSLSYLQRLPVDVLKLDRSFIAPLGDKTEDAQIVAGVVQMAKALKLAVVAEGVETLDQLTALQRLGCDLAQGYFFARPTEAQAMTALLDLARAQRAEARAGAAS